MMGAKCPHSSAGHHWPFVSHCLTLALVSLPQSNYCAAVQVLGKRGVLGRFLQVQAALLGPGLLPVTQVRVCQKVTESIICRWRKGL